MLDFGCPDLNSGDCAGTLDPCNVTQAEFICQALKLLPPGGLYGRSGCNSTEFFCAVAATYWSQWRRICALREEASPCTADLLLSEWSQVFSDDCDSFPTDPQELRDFLCDLLKTRGVLTCEFIKQHVEAAGYIVISCGTNTETTGEIVQPTCGFDLGFSPLGATFDFEQTDSCENAFRGIPCANCCDDGETANSLEGLGPCDLSPNPPYCSEGCSDCADLGSFNNGPAYDPLKYPATIDVIIDKNSPAIDPCDLPTGGLLPESGELGVGDSCLSLDFNSCAIEAIRPAHVTIRYLVNC